jgi:uncharacterized protein YndB with AHSA1/START domain
MSETETVTDAIEKEIVVRAPRSRVWQALTDSREFGRWFNVALRDPFVAGQRARGNLTHPGYEHLVMEVEVERMEPEHLFSFRWHPYAIDPDYDYTSEPTTLVAFRLDDVPEGTRIRVHESGFDRIPLARRDQAFRMNADGWAIQLQNLARHVDPPA